MTGCRYRLLGELNWNSLFLLLYFTGIGLFMILIPKYGDDFWYLKHLSSWYFDQGILYPDGGGSLIEGGIPWSGIFDTWRDHWEHDNIRLSNMLATLALLFPKWMGSGLALIAWIYAVVTGFRIAGIDRSRSAVVPFVLLMLTVLMPWRNNMGEVVYQFSYIISCGIATAVFVGLRKSVMDVASARGWTGFLLHGFLPGLLLGWWQEAFSVPFLAGILMLVLLFRNWRIPAVYGAVAGLIVGICILATSPNMWGRFSWASSSGICSPFQLGVEVAPFLLLILALILVSILSGAGRRLWRDATFIFLVTDAAAPVAIAMFSHDGVRTLTWSVFCSTFALVMLVRAVWPRLQERYNIFTLTSGVLVMAFIVAHLTLVDIYTYRFRQIHRQALVDLVENGRKSVFSTGYLLHELPPIVGCMPDYKFFLNAFCFAGEFYNDELLFRNFIVPRQLQYVKATSGTQADCERGIREVDGFYFMPKSNIDMLPEYVEMDYGSGFKRYNMHRCFFYSDADGQEYIWIYAFPSFYKTHFGELKGVRFR